VLEPGVHHLEKQSRVETGGGDCAGVKSRCREGRIGRSRIEKFTSDIEFGRPFVLVNWSTLVFPKRTKVQLRVLMSKASIFSSFPHKNF
jgi:hypothetical protein